MGAGAEHLGTVGVVGLVGALPLVFVERSRRKTLLIRLTYLPRLLRWSALLSLESASGAAGGVVAMAKVVVSLSGAAAREEREVSLVPETPSTCFAEVSSLTCRPQFSPGGLRQERNVGRTDSVVREATAGRGEGDDGNGGSSRAAWVADGGRVVQVRAEDSGRLWVRVRAGGEQLWAVGTGTGTIDRRDSSRVGSRRSRGMRAAVGGSWEAKRGASESVP